MVRSWSAVMTAVVAMTLSLATPVNASPLDAPVLVVTPVELGAYLEWTSPLQDPPEAYIIHRVAANGSEETFSVAGTVTTYVDTTVGAGAYLYFVAPILDGDEGDPSNPVPFLGSYPFCWNILYERPGETPPYSVATGCWIP